MAIQKLAYVGAQCVACGNCARYCPFGAIAIYKGLRAEVDGDKCRGCTKCVSACPADVITCQSREGASI